MRPVTVADADELAQLDMELFPDNCFNERTLAIEIERGYGWVIEGEGELAAYVLAVPDPVVMDVLRLGVRPAYRRRGYATQLLCAVLDLCATAGLGTILNVAYENETALRLYQKLGFKIAGQMQHDAWLMVTA